MLCEKCKKHELRSPEEIIDGYCVFCWMHKNADETDHLHSHIHLLEKMAIKETKRRKDHGL